MRVIGVDPGLAVTGFGIIDKINNTISAHSYGTIRPPKGVQLAARLGYLFDEITTLIDKYKPEILAIEDTFYHKNFKSAMVLGQARGTIILAGFKQNIPCVEFAPKKIKKSVKNYLNIFSDHPYIFNLGHGVLPNTKPEIIEYVIKIVRDKS